jgi:hypothetical protein
VTGSRTSAALAVVAVCAWLAVVCAGIPQWGAAIALALIVAVFAVNLFPGRLP